MSTSPASPIPKFSRRDLGITSVLVAFCAVMTFLLIRSEYFPESSALYRLPPRYLAERFLKNDSSSSLKLTWKGEPVGSFMVRVTPGEKPFIKCSTQFEMPILGKRPKANLEMECKLLQNRDVERFRLRGTAQEIHFEILADAPSDKLDVSAIGPGLNEKRYFVWSDLIKDHGKAFLKQLPHLPGNILLPTQFPQGLTDESSWKITASSSKISRLGDFMEVLVLDARLDANSWLKLWMSLTGEILKVESSFGLSALNEDFFEGMSKLPYKS